MCRKQRKPCKVVILYLRFMCFLTWNIIAQGSSQSGELLSPAEVLIAIHGIDPDRDGIPLKKAFSFFLFFFEYLLTCIHPWLNYYLLLLGHWCMQCLFWAKADIHPTSSCKSLESVGLWYLYFLNLHIGSFCCFLPKLQTDKVYLFRLSKSLYPYCSCEQYCRLLVLFQLW